MRIGFNCRFFHADYVTGVERYARNLLCSLIENNSGHELVLFGCGQESVPGFNQAEVRFSGWCGYKSAICRQLWEQIILPGLASSSKVDVLINPANTAPLRFGRNVMVIHDLAFLEHPEWFSQGFRVLYNLVVPRAARRAESIITVSEFSRSRIIELLHVDPQKVHVVYQGKDSVFKPASDEEIARTTSKFNISRPYILFVGSIAPRKNLKTAISAYNLVRQRLSTMHTFVVVGVNSFQFPKMEVTAAPEGVMLVGYAGDDDLPGLYTGADVLVYPSLYEGFGLPPLEAMACGTPVITSNCSSLPEVVGNAGLMTDPTDVGALADAICSVLTDNQLAQTLSSRGLEQAGQFTWQKTAKRTLEVLTTSI